MNNKPIMFSPPDINESDIEEVVDSLRSGWITTGPKTKLFEKEITDYCNSSKTVCLNSATAAMEMALRILNIGSGDEVITSAYTYTASASVICHVGATPILVDVEKDTCQMDYDKLSKAITSKTKAIIAVDIAGIMCDYEKIYEIINEKKELFVPQNDIQKQFGRPVIIADAAHSFGAMYNGIMSGNSADFTSFSFHAVKNLTTAEGGALTWKKNHNIDDEAIYKQIQLLSLHGQTKDALAKNSLGAWEYDIISPAYKCNMTDIQASLGLSQLRRYKEILNRRREIIQRYNKAFENTNIQVLEHYTNNTSSSGHLYLTRIKGIDVDKRNEIINKMAERGIATNVHYKPLPMLTAYKNLGFNIDDFKNSYDFYKNEITLPLYTKLTDDDVDRVIDTYLKILGDMNVLY